MKILAIETSCDETAIAILDVKRPLRRSTSKWAFATPTFQLLSNVVLSQIKIHKPFGGVVPNLAQREHQKNLVPILTEALREAKLLQGKTRKISVTTPLSLRRRGVGGEVNSYLASILNREPVLLPELEKFLKKYKTPYVDAIAVTHGPGLEPALWVGVNFAKALATIWEKPLIPINHLEGHIYASWLHQRDTNLRIHPNVTNKKFGSFVSNSDHSNRHPQFPLLALIVSGGHTELVLIKNHLQYKKLGDTRDDAAGEAFDKVAKMLKLGYPGGPEISRLAEHGDSAAIPFPRPMINSNDFDFSFSGLKTAVLYYVRDTNLRIHPNDTKKDSEYSDFHSGHSDRVANIAASFEQAVVDVLVSKTAKALKKYKVKSLVVGGGVAANKKLRLSLEILISKLFPETHLYLSPLWLTGDNAAMIAVAAYFRSLKTKKISLRKLANLRAKGNLKLGDPVAK